MIPEISSITRDTVHIAPPHRSATHLSSACDLQSSILDPPWRHRRPYGTPLAPHNAHCPLPLLTAHWL